MHFGYIFIHLLAAIFSIYSLCGQYTLVELAWCSGSVMDYHAAAHGSIPGGNGVKTKLHALRKGR